VSATESAPLHCADSGYRHEALLYGDIDEFYDVTLGFIEGAVEQEEPIMVALSSGKIAALRANLDDTADKVLFVDMEELGKNPARIIPGWQEFLSAHPRSSGRLRGIGEPIVPWRDAAQLAECQRHEALLNVAFAVRDFWLLCPYDTSSLQARVIDEARRNHPFVYENRNSGPSHDFAGNDVLAEPSREPLPPPPEQVKCLRFQAGDLPDIRLFVSLHAAYAGLGAERVAEIVLAANEIATNSLRHGGGQGTVRAWEEAGWFVCEFEDEGLIADPMIGRIRPAATNSGGRGLWIANQICEVVQIRFTDVGSIVRLRSRIDPPRQ
jgi:anti-sigma regulatory factor (Ser/Thr protein kinase)